MFFSANFPGALNRERGSASLLMVVDALCIFDELKSQELECSNLAENALCAYNGEQMLCEGSYNTHEWLCRGVLVLQMYSGMASINWMFVEGLLLHSRVTVHIFKQDAPFKLYYCIGWGIPALCIGSWCSLMYMYHNTSCWSGYGDLPYIWVITGPMLAALLVNSVFLVDIIRVLVTKRHVNFSTEANQVRCALYDGLPQQKYCPWPHAQPAINACGRKKAIKATALLFPLLGIPHLLFCINPKDNGKLEEAYMIVNAFVKSSQGLFVSVLYCFMNNDVDPKCAVYETAVLEYLTSEILEIASKKAKERRSHLVTLEDITFAMHNDPELKKAFPVAGEGNSK
ncbi:PDF receptor [Araneus ventricosus]|uniref:PDF receptor n=1 Tax=Araneus ventricosus TaxID=182803 RepID=A0A4Y2LJD0_ARAVE|nr:PDF receptor [Araneus ventricosus]